MNTSPALFIFIALILANCTLASSTQVTEAQVLTPPVQTIQPTSGFRTAIPSFPTMLPDAASTAMLPNTLITACIPQNSHWPLYTVQSGDTLAHIAGLTGTTVDQLVQVNCLTDANVIQVGQHLRVRLWSNSTPRPTVAFIDDHTIPDGVCFIAPTAGTPNIYHPDDPTQIIARLHGKARFMGIVADGTLVDLPGCDHDGLIVSQEIMLGGCDEVGHPIPPPSNVPTLPPSQLLDQCLPIQNSGNHVIMRPAMLLDESCYRLFPGEITITWFNAPNDFERVEFWARDGIRDVNIIGVDDDALDGASTRWTVQTGQLHVIVYAQAFSEAGNPVSGEIAVFVDEQ